jgi:hypothetical protein
MQIFNLDSLKTFPYDERDKNVLFKVEEFKTRIIRLLPGENIPECEMASSVISMQSKNGVKIIGIQVVKNL